MRIAVDLDDVVLDFVGGLREAVKKEYGVEIPEESIRDFNLRPYLDPIIGRNWWSWMEERTWLWANFPAVDGAIGTLDRLRRDGHYLELLTSKPRWAEHNVYKWLGKWRPPFQQVTIVGKDDNKADFSDATILIDDKWENVEDFSNAGREALLFTRPHNEKHLWLPDRVQRVKGWAETYETLTRRATNGSL
jgi:uncharacterized HAD superfamily protein